MYLNELDAITEKEYDAMMVLNVKKPVFLPRLALSRLCAEYMKQADANTIESGSIDKGRRPHRAFYKHAL